MPWSLARRGRDDGADAQVAGWTVGGLGGVITGRMAGRRHLILL
jgi:hypothetical protein